MYNQDFDSESTNTLMSWGTWRLMLGSILKIDHHFKGVTINMGILSFLNISLI